MAWLDLFFQSLNQTFKELWANKLRSSLSLLGVSIGIFCIVSVLTAVDSLEKNIKDGISSLGDEVIYIQKWPLLFSGDYPWWKFINRPKVNQQELKLLKKKVQLAEALCILYNKESQLIKSDFDLVEGAEVSAISWEYDKIRDFNLVTGRYFNQQEMATASGKAILGSALAATLFPESMNAVGQQLKLKGYKLEVIGVLEKEGQGVIDFSLDNQMLIPYNFANKIYTIGPRTGTDPLIAVKAKDGVLVSDLKYELEGVMRSIRKIHPKQENDFALNQMSILKEIFGQGFAVLSLAGAVIGLLAILVGVFGTANIMFVAVKERTSIIGIKKALGAKKGMIISEFLLESIALCLIGGIAGLGLVFILFTVLNKVIPATGDVDFQFILGASNLITAFIISLITGIVSGIIPAVSAANLHPVNAIRNL